MDEQQPRPSDLIQNVYKETDPTKMPHYKPGPDPVTEPTLRYVQKARGSSIWKPIMVYPDPNAPAPASEETPVEEAAAETTPQALGEGVDDLLQVVDGLSLSEIEDILYANSTQRNNNDLFDDGTKAGD
ncbi:MAG: hypothetical protein IJT34_04640 [Butyrivibrio sp.]|nr:hypothetical protein [Butyrivibrio sp.]